MTQSATRTLTLAIILLLLAISTGTGAFRMAKAKDGTHSMQVDLREAVRLATLDEFSGISAAHTPLGKILRSDDAHASLPLTELAPLYAEQILSASRSNLLFRRSSADRGLAVVHLPDRYAIMQPVIATLLNPEGDELASWRAWDGYFAIADPPYPDEVWLPKIPIESVAGATGLRLRLHLQADDREAQLLLADIPLYPWLLR